MKTAVLVQRLGRLGPYHMSGLGARVGNVRFTAIGFSKIDNTPRNTDLASVWQASRDIIRGWPPAAFAENMLKAAEAAFKAPRPRTRLFDRALLFLLARR